MNVRLNIEGFAKNTVLKGLPTKKIYNRCGEQGGRGAGGRGKNQNILSRKVDNLFSGSPQPKPEKRHRWGSRLLAGMKPKGKGKKCSPGQLKLLWDDGEMDNEEIERVASKFVKANCYNPNPIAKDNVLQKEEPE